MGGVICNLYYKELGFLIYEVFLKNEKNKINNFIGGKCVKVLKYKFLEDVIWFLRG